MELGAKASVPLARRVALAVICPLRVVLPVKEMVLFEEERSWPAVRETLKRAMLPPLAVMVPLVLSREPGERPPRLRVPLLTAESVPAFVKGRERLKPRVWVSAEMVPALLKARVVKTLLTFPVPLRV